MSRTKPSSTLKTSYNIIALETISNFEHYVVTWFSNVASLYFYGETIQEVSKKAITNKQKVLDDLHKKSEEYLRDLASRFKLDVCTLSSPIPITPNDDPQLFSLCKAVSFLNDARRGNIHQYPLPPALSLEFAEYVRGFIPKVRDGALKRKVIFVSSEVLALAVLGAHISRLYAAGDEVGYVFISTYNPKLVDVVKLNVMIKNAARAVIDGEGSRSTLLVGVASASALNVGKHIFDKGGRTTYSSVRIARTGNKTLLKAFELLDVTDLAGDILKLGIASAVYNLIVNYPRSVDSKRDKRARTLRSVIEEVARAILVYHYYNDVSGLYRALRAITTGATSNDLSSLLGETWNEVLYELLKVRV